MEEDQTTPEQQNTEEQPEVSKNTEQPKKPFNKKWLWLVLAIVIIAVGLIVWFVIAQDDEDADNEQPTISSYEECVAAGYPIQESFPERCTVPGGETFVRQLTEEEQQALNDNTSNIPEGWVEYNNEELGFSFAYPEEWGEVSINETEWEHVGLGFNIEFSSSEIKGMAASSDYQYTGPGRGGVFWEVSDGDFEIVKMQELSNAEEAKTDDTYALVVALNSSNSIVLANSDCLSGGATLTGTYDISGQGGSLSILKLGYINQSVDCNDLTKSNVLSNINPAIREEFIQLVDNLNP